MTDLVDDLRSVDPALGAIPELRLDDVLERYPTAALPTRDRRRGNLRVVVAAVAAVAILAGGAMIGVRTQGSKTHLVSAASVIPPELLVEALALAPTEQRAVLADGVVSDEELAAAGRAMGRCMAVSGSGEPTAGIFSVVRTVEVPSKVDGRDDICERDHIRWIWWASTTQERVREWGDDQVMVFMAADATDGQLDLVRSTLGRVAPASTARFVDKAAAIAEIATLFPSTPEIVAATQPADVPTSFRVAGGVPQGLVEAVKFLPGVMLVRVRPNDFTPPPGNDVHLPPSADAYPAREPDTTLPTSVASGDMRLAGRRFVSTSIVNGNDHPFASQLELSISFDEAIMTATPSPGCNRPSGPYRLDGDRLIAGPFVGPALGCAGINADGWVVSVLANQPRLLFEAGHLTLLAGDTTISFRPA